MDGFAPVIVIEGFLGLGVVLLLYWLHLREMKQTRAEKARRAAQESATADAPVPSAHDSTNSGVAADTETHSRPSR